MLKHLLRLSDLAVDVSRMADPNGAVFPLFQGPEQGILAPNPDWGFEHLKRTPAMEQMKEEVAFHLVVLRDPHGSGQLGLDPDPAAGVAGAGAFGLPTGRAGPSYPVGSADGKTTTVKVKIQGRSVGLAVVHERFLQVLLSNDIKLDDPADLVIRSADGGHN